jgi:SAM-dependent MidA family methyltransferase
LSRKLRRGFALVVDYGSERAEYYAPHRISGTLEAVGEHRREPDPLARPGAIDLTAHVDFTSLAEAAESAGMVVAGFTDQHHFLVGLSRLHFAEGAPPDRSEARAFQTLSHPTMLGRAFKVLCLKKGVAEGRSVARAEETQEGGKGAVGLSRSVAAPAVLSGFTFAPEPRLALGLP